jgi:hypothetical protein
MSNSTLFLCDANTLPGNAQKSHRNLLSCEMRFRCFPHFVRTRDATDPARIIAQMNGDCLRNSRHPATRGGELIVSSSISRPRPIHFACVDERDLGIATGRRAKRNASHFGCVHLRYPASVGNRITPFPGSPATLANVTSRIISCTSAKIVCGCAYAASHVVRNADDRLSADSDAGRSARLPPATFPAAIYITPPLSEMRRNSVCARARTTTTER